MYVLKCFCNFTPTIDVNFQLLWTFSFCAEFNRNITLIVDELQPFLHSRFIFTGFKNMQTKIIIKHLFITWIHIFCDKVWSPWMTSNAEFPPRDAFPGFGRLQLLFLCLEKLLGCFYSMFWVIIHLYCEAFCSI